MSNHLMLAVLGVHPRLTRYIFGGQEVQAHLSPVALLDLLPEPARPDGVLALCTSEAKQDSGGKLCDQLQDRYAVRLIDIPAGNDQAQIGQFLDAVTSAVPRDVDLTVDITGGFRHFSFLTYAALMYLIELQGIRVRGVYYGLLGQGKDASTPFLDLHPMMELPRWTRALHVLRKTGSTLPITDLLDTGSRGDARRQVSDDFRYLAEAYLAGLPLELGQRATTIKTRHRKPLKQLIQREHQLPLSDSLLGRLFKILSERALDHPPSGKGWKKGVELTRGELSRQAELIDSLLENRHQSTALGLMHEWTVSWAVFEKGFDEPNWLDYKKTRRPAKNQLDAIKEIYRTPDLAHILTPQQREVARFWDDLTELRNGFAHHGMRKQILIGDRRIEKKFEAIKNYWSNTLCTVPELSLSIGGGLGGRILVSPVGRRPGVLYSALKACHADGHSEGLRECLVICSEETEASIGEVLERAGYDGNVTPLRLEDPFAGGGGEIRRLRNEARRNLVGADEVLVNVTGGTTLMGLVAEGIASEARRFARPTRRFGLIDRRPPHEQDSDPYQVGDAFWLDSIESADGY